jgi:hypothetical protein
MLSRKGRRCVLGSSQNLIYFPRFKRIYRSRAHQALDDVAGEIGIRSKGHRLSVRTALAVPVEVHH